MQAGLSPLSIRLSEGQAQPQAIQSIPVATGEPLPESEIEAIFSRLPGLTSELKTNSISSMQENLYRHRAQVVPFRRPSLHPSHSTARAGRQWPA